MMELEGPNREYKRQFTDKIQRSVVAFANTQGGKIIIGVDDDCTVAGLSDIDGVMLQVSNMLRMNIKPDITMFARCYTEFHEGKALVVIDVRRGTEAPYYLASKGIRPEGVYVRVGASSLMASDAAILNMIRESAGDSFEERSSLKQDLTFDACREEFDVANIKLAQSQMRTLGLIGEDGLYTNLALLLSDQCMHSIKLAVFQGTSKRVFRDRFEFTGSLFTQLSDCFDCMNRFNSISSDYMGIRRVDRRDYPSIALREVLLNAIIHRDYSYASSILVSIFDDRLEIVSLGGLLQGLSFEDMLLGVSVTRNKYLADVFFRLKLVEAYGTGIPKIMECYEGVAGREPKIEASPNAFKMTLYNLNEQQDEDERDLGHLIAEDPGPKLSSEQMVLLPLFSNKVQIKRRDVEAAFRVSQATANVYLRRWLAQGLIYKIGNGRNVVYRRA